MTQKSWFLVMKRIQKTFKAAASTIKAYNRHMLAALVMLSIVYVVYWRDISILVNEALRNEAVSHILLIPFLVGFLLYRSKDQAIASVTSKHYGRGRTYVKYLDEVVGVALCLVAFLLYWFGSYTFYPLEYHLVSLPIFIAGLVMVLFGFHTLRVLLFPILFLLFLIPLPSEIIYTVGGSLANLNTYASYTILSTLGLPVTLETTYGPPTIAITTASQPIYFAVDVPCSGIYSFVAFLMLATFMAYIAISPTFKRAGLFALGFLIFQLMNIIRITGIVFAGYWLGEEIAMLIFHTITGWLLIFIGMLLVLVVAENLLKIQFSHSSQGIPSCPTCPTSLENLGSFCVSCGKFLGTLRSKISSIFWAKLLLLLLGSSLVTLVIQAPTFAIASGTLEITSNSALENATNVFPTIAEYKLQFLYRDVNYEKIAGQDASLLYAYIPANFSESTVYVDVGIADTISKLHNWEVCLITWQLAQGQNPIVDVLDSRDIQLLENVPIIARYLVFETPSNYTQVTLYWYEKATFNTGLTVAQKYVRISVIILTLNSTKYPQLENELLTFGQAIAAHWQPLETQSLISIGIPLQQGLLGLAIAFVTVTKSAEYTHKWRKKTQALRLFNNYASPTEKLVLETVRNLTQDAKGAQISLIASTLASTTGEPITINDLNSILNQLAEHGIVERRIMKIQGTPVLVWKS